MPTKKMVDAARIEMTLSGASLVDESVEAKELENLRTYVAKYGYEPIASIEDFEHIRINVPESKGFHRDWAVRWGS